MHCNVNAPRDTFDKDCDTIDVDAAIEMPAILREFPARQLFGSLIARLGQEVFFATDCGKGELAHRRRDE